MTTGEQADASTGSLDGPVLVVGAGLIGASVAMALSRAGVETYIRDVVPAVAHVAASRGAGSDLEPMEAPNLVVVATPPDVLGLEVARALCDFPDAVVTDVGSVKAKPLAYLKDLDVDRTRYVGGHPMAGSERSGPLASDADLFDGRTWAVIDRPDCAPAALRLVEQLVQACGAVAVHMSTLEHDRAVARVSHLPHLVAALTAGRLVEAPHEHLALEWAGPAGRDPRGCGRPGTVATDRHRQCRCGRRLAAPGPGRDRLFDRLARDWGRPWCGAGPPGRRSRRVSDSRQAWRSDPGAGHGLGGDPGRAWCVGKALRRCRRCRGQHRGPPHRPRPRAPSA